MAETEEVARCWERRCRDGNLADEKSTADRARSCPLKDPRFESLDIRFHSHAVPIAEPARLAEGRIRLAARELKLMPDGALDAVNEWAFDVFDDPIIVEQGEEMEVQSHLLESQP